MADDLETGDPALEPEKDDWSPPSQAEIDQVLGSNVPEEPEGDKPPGEPAAEPGKEEPPPPQTFKVGDKEYTEEQLSAALDAQGQVDEKLKNLEAGFTTKFQDLARDREHVALMQKDLEIRLGTMGEVTPAGKPGNWEQKLLERGHEPNDPEIVLAKEHDRLTGTVEKLTEKLDTVENNAALDVQARHDDDTVGKFEGQVSSLCEEHKIPEGLRERVLNILKNDDRTTLENTPQLFTELLEKFIQPLQVGAAEKFVEDAGNAPGGKPHQGNPNRQTPTKPAPKPEEQRDPFDEDDIQREIRDRTAEMPEWAHLHPNTR